MSYLRRHGNQRFTPQSQPLPGRTDQVENEAGGYVFQADSWERLRRFLILGTEGGSFYASEQKMTAASIGNVRACIEQDGLRVLEETRDISTRGLAPKNDQALYVLACLLSFGDNAVKREAVRLTAQIARTGTHLFMLADFIESLSGWGRAKRRAIASWYTGKTPDKLAYQLIKYRQRNGWTHKDLLRLSHPEGPTLGHAQLYAYTTHPDHGVMVMADDGEGMAEMVSVPPVLLGYIKAQRAIDVDRLVEIIKEYDLPREALPTEALREAKVWGALLGGEQRASEQPRMPMTALVRNLPTMTRVGLIAPFSAGTKEVLARLSNKEEIQRSRIHPMQLLIARLTYASGFSLRGKATWTPVPQVIDALDAAFYMAFQNVEPSGKRIMLGVDWSGSMGHPDINGVPGLTPALAAAAMALVTASTEPDYYVLAFATHAKPVTISKGMTLQEAYDITAAGTGEGTDVGVPIRFAANEHIDADAFVIYTDGQTWAGRSHAVQELDAYRRAVQHEVRFVSVAMVANEYTVADPLDAASLNVVGFDASAPRVISDFVAGRI